jgi:hypothetical protein
LKKIRLGNGKSIHAANEDENGLWTLCGSDHQTNMGRRMKRETQKEVTCKKCLKRING